MHEGVLVDALCIDFYRICKSKQLSSLLRICRNCKPRNRPSFRQILLHLDIASADVLSTPQETYFKSQVWFISDRHLNPYKQTYGQVSASVWTAIRPLLLKKGEPFMSALARPSRLTGMCSHQAEWREEVKQHFEKIKSEGTCLHRLDEELINRRREELRSVF